VTLHAPVPLAAGAHVSYAKGWFRARKRPTERLTVAQARALHDAGELYCALLGDPDRPTCFLELRGGNVFVGCLDDRLREVLTYHFPQRAPGRLFLSMATWREFDGDSDTVRQGTTYVFQEDGRVAIRRETLVPTHHAEETEDQVDVGGHWEDAPAFGAYERLARAQR
jgi:hypothetical protein